MEGDLDMSDSQPTMLDVAKAAGVSRTSVSNAFNDPSRLSKDVRQRILTTAARLGYVGPNPLGRAVRRGRTGTVGMIFEESLRFLIEDPFSRALLLGWSDAVSSEHLGLNLLPLVDDDVAAVNDALVDGVLAYRVRPDHPAMETVRRRRLRLVRIGPGSASHPLDLVVSVDEVAGAEMAATHLLELGHRRLHVLVDMVEELPGSEDPGNHFPFDEQRVRWKGYSRAAARYGAELIPMSVGRNVQESGCQAAHKALATGEVTCFLAMTDVLAVGVLKALEERGLTPGEEVSVIGFDDIPEAAEHDLTTVRQPIEERGQAAARLLLAEEPPRQGVTLPCSLVTRGSTGPAR